MSRILRHTRLRWLWFGLTVLAYSCVTNLAKAQIPDTVAHFQETLQSDFFGVDARSLGMGNAGIATTRDGSAMIYNPANLALIRRIEVRGGLSHQRVSNDSRVSRGGETFFDGRAIRETRFNALSLAVPVPAYRGSLVVAFGLHRPNSFDRAAGFSTPLTPNGGRVLESGGLWKWTAAGAIDLSPRLSTGVAVHLLTGKDTYRWNPISQGSDQVIDIKYVGVSGTAGLNYAVSHTLTAGLVLETPTYLQAEETDPADPGSLAAYSITRPFVFGLGLSSEFDRITVTSDVHYTDWSQLNITYDAADLNATPELIFIRDNLKEAISFHLGAEYLFPAQGIELRGGYYIDQLPIDSRYIESQRKYFTLGIGFLIDQILTLDLAYVNGGYELRDTNPGKSFAKYKTQRVFATFGYRI